jgi:hypothetical protein
MEAASRREPSASEAGQDASIVEDAGRSVMRRNQHARSATQEVRSASGTLVSGSAVVGSLQGIRQWKNQDQHSHIQTTTLTSPM